jgi:hypothetical protein
MDLNYPSTSHQTQDLDLIPEDSLFTPSQRSFLIALRTSPTVVQAAAMAGVALSTVYLWRSNPEFAEAFELAKELFKAKIEQEVFDRAIHGYEEPIYYLGAEVGRRKVVSDTLLQFLAKRHIPEYRDKQTITVERSLATVDLMEQFRGLPAEEREQLTRLLEKLDAQAAGERGAGEESTESPRKRILARVLPRADVADRGAGTEAGVGETAARDGGSLGGDPLRGDPQAPDQHSAGLHEVDAGQRDVPDVGVGTPPPA